MPQKFFSGLFLGSVAFCTTLTLLNAADLELRTDNLKLLSTDSTGQLTSFAVAGEEYLKTFQQPFSAFDAATEREERFVGDFRKNGDGELVFRGEAPELKLSLEAVYVPVPGKDAFLVRATLADQTGNDRTIRLQFDLSLKQANWRYGSTWDNSPDGAIQCVPGLSYEQTEAIGNVRASQPPWLMVDDGNVGVMLAHSMMNPRFFSYRMNYSQDREANLTWEVPLGLTSETRKFPGQASVEFVIASFDGRHSLRGGMQTYYDLFPEIFESRLKEKRAWALWIPSDTMAEAQKCGMLLNQREWDLDFVRNSETAIKLWRETQEAGLKVLLYSEPWGVYMPFPNGWVDENSTGPAPSSYQTAADTEKMKDLFAQDLGDNSPSDRFPGTLSRDDVARIAAACAIEYTPEGDWRLNAYGKNGFVWEGERQNFDTGMLIVNSDPELPRPNRLDINWERARYGYLFDLAEQHGLRVDGLYLDSELFYAGWNDLNFRREHWQYADLPLTYVMWDGKPLVAQHMALANQDFMIYNRQLADKHGVFVAGNTWNPLIQFVVPHVDMVGVGEHWDPVPEHFTAMMNDFRVFRYYSRNKLLSTMDYVLNFGGGVPETPEAVESVMEPRLNACLMYGIYPGTANAWAFPEKIALIVPLFERYVPLFDAMNKAGWQVFPQVEISGDGADAILRERWGERAADGLFFTLHNSSKEDRTVTLEWNPADFGVETFAAITELLAQQEIHWEQQEGKVAAHVSIPAGRTILLQVQ